MIPPVARSRGPHWPLVVALAVLLATVAAYSWLALRLNDGHFVYAQDDPYIHLALARTLAQHGVWGLSPEEFAPASSSPLWTVLLAIIGFACGTGPWWPFALNVTGAVLVVWVWDRALRPALGPVPRFVALVVATLVVPLPTLVFIGMEHTVHVAVVVALCAATATRLANRERDALWPGGMALAFLATGLRYEGLFVVTAVVTALFVGRSRLTALWLGLAAALAPSLYAAYAVFHGGLPLPNSVLMKSDPARFGSWTGGLGVLSDWVGVLSLYQRPAFVALTVAALLLAAAMAGPHDGSSSRASAALSGTRSVAMTMLGLFLGTELLHVCLVKIEWFFRYEAYVIALGLLAVTLGVAEVLRSCAVAEELPAGTVRRRAVLACAVVLAIPLVTRAAKGMLVTVPATGEVYRQQYQMALFFGEYYRGETVALNDIGAVSWLAPVKVIDLIGLASSEVADARRRDADGTVFFGDLLRRHGAAAACVYDFYFSGRRALPPLWQKVGEWTIPHDAAVSGATVAFYAPSEPEASRLRTALDRFSDRLPTGVTYRRWP